jgi:hypothetical protein
MIKGKRQTTPKEPERESPVAESENTSKDVENGQKQAQHSIENTSPSGIEPGLPGLVGQSYSIEDIINRCMGDKGYCDACGLCFVMG